MPIILPDHILRRSGHSEEELRLEIAIFLFQKYLLTLGQASELAGLSQYAFQQQLGKRGLFIHYDKDDLHEDMKTLQKPLP